MINPVKAERDERIWGKGVTYVINLQSSWCATFVTMYHVDATHQGLLFLDNGQIRNIIYRHGKAWMGPEQKQLRSYVTCSILWNC